MGLKAVLFDLDNTLYTDFHACDAYGYECMGRYAEQELGVDSATFLKAFRANRQRLGRQQPGMPPIHDRVLVAQGALERLGRNAIRHAGALHKIYWDAMFSKMEIMPGVCELLRDLKQAGVKTAICTDMLAYIQMKKLVYLGLEEDIDYLVSSEEAGMDKPGSAIFWLALHKCGCLPQEAVMVGDNFRHDIQGAMDVGITGIWLNWPGQSRPEEERTFTEAHTFPEAADKIRSLL